MSNVVPQHCCLAAHRVCEKPYTSISTIGGEVGCKSHSGPGHIIVCENIRKQPRMGESTF